MAINDICIKGRTSHDVTKLILQTRDQVKFKYNKLHLPDKQPNSIAVAYQKIKYRILESIKLDDSENVYRHLIIEGHTITDRFRCNAFLRFDFRLTDLFNSHSTDKGWRKKINRINCLEQMYRQLLYSIKHVVKAHVDICQIYKVFGDVLGEIAAKETQQGASEALARFADNHRQAKNFGVRMIKRMKPAS